MDDVTHSAHDVKAVVLVAGHPGRDFPADSPPTCLHHYKGRVVLEGILQALREGGVTSVRLVVGYNAERVRAWVEAMRWPVEIAHNDAWPTDPMGSIEVGIEGATGDVLLIAGDVVIDADLVRGFLATDPRRPAWIRSIVPRDHPEPMSSDFSCDVVRVPRHLLSQFRDAHAYAERFSARYPTHPGTGFSYGAAIREAFEEFRPVAEVVIPTPLVVDRFEQTDEYVVRQRLVRVMASSRYMEEDRSVVERHPWTGSSRWGWSLWARTGRGAASVAASAVIAAGRRLTSRGRLAVGLCTVTGRRTGYLAGTIGSLLSHWSRRSDIAVVVYHCDRRGVDNPEVATVKAIFADEVRAGLLRVVRVDWHPESITTPDAGSSYLGWRAKQNYDLSEALRLSRGLGDAYMHVEDDVVACSGWDLYVFEEMRRHPKWEALRMAGGVIGWVLRPDDLVGVSARLLERLRDQPCDWIVEEYMSRYRRVIKTSYSIFQHVGRDRSLAGAIQPVVFDNFIGRPGRAVSPHP